MPCGKVNSGDFRNGTPMVLPHQFGTPVGTPEPFGNVIPQSNPTLDSNPITWPPTPNHFGNTVEFSLQSVPPIVVIAPGSTGTVNINLTQLLDSPTATLSYTGAPAGVTIAFAPNPDTGTSVATITVSASVPAGKYTIEVDGTGTDETNHTNIHLVVAAAGSGPPPPTGFAVVAHAATAGGATPNTLPVDTTGANFLVAVVGTVVTFGSPTIQDNKGNTWQPLTIYGPNSSTNPSVQMFYVFNPIVGTGHFFTASGVNGTSIEVLALSGADITAAVFEVGSDHGNTSAGVPIQPGSVTPASVGDLIISGYVNHDNNGGLSGPAMVDSGMTVSDQSADTFGIAAMAYLITTGAGAVNPSWTATLPGNVFNASVNIAVFKHA